MIIGAVANRHDHQSRVSKMERKFYVLNQLPGTRDEDWWWSRIPTRSGCRDMTNIGNNSIGGEPDGEPG